MVTRQSGGGRFAAGRTRGDSAPPVAPPAEGRPSTIASISLHSEHSVALTLLGGLSGSSAHFGPGAGATFGHRTGFTAGLGLILGAASTVGFELDGLFVQKGLAANASGATQSVHTAYVEAPMLVRVSLGHPVGGTLLLGGFGAYEVGCSESITAATDAEGSAEPCAADANFTNHRKVDGGMVAGAGLRFGVISLSIRYDVGFVKLYREDQAVGTSRAWCVVGAMTF